jgi:hypothetical protein
MPSAVHGKEVSYRFANSPEELITALTETCISTAGNIIEKTDRRIVCVSGGVSGSFINRSFDITYHDGVSNMTGRVEHKAVGVKIIQLMPSSLIKAFVKWSKKHHPELVELK